MLHTATAKVEQLIRAALLTQTRGPLRDDRCHYAGGRGRHQVPGRAEGSHEHELHPRGERAL